MARLGAFWFHDVLTCVGVMGSKRLSKHDDVPADELRRLARREPDRAAAAQIQAVAGALEGLTRAEEARRWRG